LHFGGSPVDRERGRNKERMYAKGSNGSQTVKPPPHLF